MLVRSSLSSTTIVQLDGEDTLEVDECLALLKSMDLTTGEWTSGPIP